MNTAVPVIVIGASTGGTEAVKKVLLGMPVDCPPILISQHMPQNFTASFAKRLNDLCAISVSEAQNGEAALSGHAYVAPGHSHLLLERNGSRYCLALSQGPALNRHRPSVDMLFQSAAEHAGAQALGVILTGMGKDGARGLYAMKQAGGYTYAQDAASCVVFGMPKEAIALGAVDEVLPIQEISKRILARVYGMQAGLVCSTPIPNAC